MKLRKHIFFEEEGEGGSGGGEEVVETDEPGEGEEAPEGEEDPEGSGEGEGEGEGAEGAGSGEPNPLASLSTEQAQSVLNNANAFEQLRADPEFEGFFKRAVARMAGIETPEPNGTPQNKDEVDYSEMSTEELIGKIVDQRVEAQMQNMRDAFGPLVQDYASRQEQGLREKYPNLDELKPQVAKFRQENPWAKDAPFAQVVKLVAPQTAQIVRGKPNPKKPRGARNGKPARTQADINKMSTLSLMEEIAREQGIPLE